MESRFLTTIEDDRRIKTIIDPAGVYPSARINYNWISPLIVKDFDGALLYHVKLPWRQYIESDQSKKIYNVMDELQIPSYRVYKQVAAYEFIGIVRATAARYIIELNDEIVGIMLRLRLS